MGDSIGHWEGETLVVETTNFPQQEGFMGSWKNLKVTEWFTRISPSRINYRFQVEDPDTWATPWGGEYNFSPLKGSSTSTPATRGTTPCRRSWPARGSRSGRPPRRRPRRHGLRRRGLKNR
jgi:hypothetical protein